jgi:Domain of unknown function (DUF4434)
MTASLPRLAHATLLERIACVKPPITSTFLQPLNVHRGRTQAQWLDDLVAMKRLGANQLFLQWMELNGESFADGAGNIGDLFLTPLLAAAEEADVALQFGLSSDLTQTGLYERSATSLATHLNARRDASLELAQKITRVAGKSPVFAGWYLPEELDDASLSNPQRRKAWSQYLATMTATLTSIRPDASVTVSSYVTGAMKAEAFAEFWGTVWETTPVTMLLQDGVGARHFATLEQIAPYLGAIEAQAMSKSASWGVIIELFEQTSGPPVNDQPYKAAPASLDRIIKQINQAAKFRSATLSSYAMPEHMLPSAGAAAAGLGRLYAKRYCS